MNETNRIEYKLEYNSDIDIDIEKEVIAFLNYKEGGYVYFGIDKDGDVIGIDNVDECMLKIKDRLKNNISPSGRDCFVFMENFTRIILPIDSTYLQTIQKTTQKTTQKTD